VGGVKAEAEEEDEVKVEDRQAAIERASGWRSRSSAIAAGEIMAHLINV